jgi:hypothetical protein
MMDQYVNTGNQQALQIATAMGRWAKTNVESVLARGGINLWQV